MYALLQYLLSYLVIHNLGQNKMEQQTPTPPPPQIKDEAAQREKTHHLPIFDLGVRGSIVFPFILSKVVACIIHVINPLTRGLVPSSSFLFSLCLLFCNLSFFGHDLCEKSNEKCTWHSKYLFITAIALLHYSVYCKIKVLFPLPRKNMTLSIN